MKGNGPAEQFGRIREAASERLYQTVAGAVAAEQERALRATLQVPADGRVSTLERWRHGPRSVTGKGMVAALERVGEIAALGIGAVDLQEVPEPYRREIKGMRNIQEARHSLARHVCHGNKGELRHGYQAGMEDQLGALGLVLSCITLWNTIYLDAALTELRTHGYPVLETELARLSANLDEHISVDGHYTFRLPDLRGCRRPLRDPDAIAVA